VLTLRRGWAPRRGLAGTGTPGRQPKRWFAGKFSVNSRGAGNATPLWAEKTNLDGRSAALPLALRLYRFLYFLYDTWQLVLMKAIQELDSRIRV